jgi:hypothetical protein
MEELAKKYPNKTLSNAFINPPAPLELTLANFKGWTLINIVFGGASSGNSNFSNATIKGIDTLNTVFSKELKNPSFQNAKLENVVFQDKVTNGNFQNATLTNVQFTGDTSGNFDNAKLTNIHFSAAYGGNFVDAKVISCSDKNNNALVVKNGNLVTLASTLSPEPAATSTPAASAAHATEPAAAAPSAAPTTPEPASAATPTKSETK